MSPAALGLELRMLRRAARMLDARVTGLEEQVLSTIARGTSVPYFSIQHGQGRTVWKSPTNEILALSNALNVDIAKPGLLTPKQAIKAGLPVEVVALISHAPSGSAELVEDTNDSAARVFK